MSAVLDIKPELGRCHKSCVGPARSLKAELNSGLAEINSTGLDDEHTRLRLVSFLAGLSFAAGEIAQLPADADPSTHGNEDQRRTARRLARAIIGCEAEDSGIFTVRFRGDRLKSAEGLHEPFGEFRHNAANPIAQHLIRILEVEPSEDGSSASTEGRRGLYSVTKSAVLRDGGVIEYSHAFNEAATTHRLIRLN